MFHKKPGKDKREYKDEEETKWIPDHKHKECMLCHKQFNLINRKHHCRNCGSLVCNDCSKNKWLIEHKYERICNLCFQSSPSYTSHSQSVQSNETSYNPALQMLSQPTFLTWLATFEKSWIRSRYPKKYKKYKKQLLKQRVGQTHAPKALKPTNATMKSKLTPKVLEKRMEQHNAHSSKTQMKYQRPQKEKYASAKLRHSTSVPLPTIPNKLTPSPKTKNKKKKHNPLILVQTGLLYLNIMEAQGLPDCDMFSQPDGYCIYYVTNNDPCFGETTKYSTKVQHNTYEPEWNEDETIVITNTTGKLVIELWDYDFGESDDYLGRVEIDISDLFLHFACQQARYTIIDDWFEVKLAPEWETHKPPQKKKTVLDTLESKKVYVNPHCATLLRQKYLSTSRILQIADDDEDEANSEPIYRRLSLPLLNISALNEDIVKKKCFMHLQIKLRATFWGHFISMFDPLVLPPPKQQPFDMDRFYAELNVLLSYAVYPVMESSQTAMDTLFWIKYMWASVYVMMYGYCIFHPWFAVFWIQFRLLVFACHSYVKQTAGIGNPDIALPALLHVLCVVFGLIPTLLNTVWTKNKELMDKDKAEQQDSSDDEEEQTKETPQGEVVAQEEDITMSGFTRMIGNNIVRVGGLKDNLGWYQELLVWMNGIIKYIIELFTWKYVNITSIIVIGLGVSCLLLVVLRDTAFHQYEMLVLGTAILTYFSKPVQFVQWLVYGVSRWYYTYYAPYTKYKTELNTPRACPVEGVETRKITKLDTVKEKLRYLWGLAKDLLFGLMIFVRVAKQRKAEKKAKVFHERSQTDPTGDIVKGFKPPPLKRTKGKASANEGVYLSKDVGSKEDTLKRNKYNTTSVKESKSIINKFGTMFKSGGKMDANDGYIQQNKKRKQRKQIRKAKTMKKQPTLLRKRTLKRIEDKADERIDSMMTKLHQAKSAHSVF